MLLLSAPSGHERGVPITVMWTGEGWPSKEEATLASGAFLPYGCPPLHCRRYASALHASGRFEVRISPEVMKHLAHLNSGLEMLGFCLFIRWDELGDHHRPCEDYRVRMLTEPGKPAKVA